MFKYIIGTGFNINKTISKNIFGKQVQVKIIQSVYMYIKLDKSIGKKRKRKRGKEQS